MSIGVEDEALATHHAWKIFSVAEAKDKGTPEIDTLKLTLDEQMKIKCGKAHFNEFESLEYKVVNKLGQLID